MRSDAIREYGGVAAGRCTRLGTDTPWRSVDGRRGRIEPDAPCARPRAAWTSRYGRRRPRETFGRCAGHDGTEKASCIEAETVVAHEVVAGGLGGIPGRTRSRDTVAATPSAPNKRPSAHVEFDTPRSPQATARQLHRGASRSNAGLYRLRRRTADRPAKLTRTPARAADAAPGAVDPSRSAPHLPPMGSPASRSAAVRGPSFPGLITTPSLTRSAAPAYIGYFEVTPREGDHADDLPLLSIPIHAKRVAAQTGCCFSRFATETRK